jgi:hypothetical protein
MRDIECPYCLYVNRVAGMFEAGKAEGAGQIVLYCAYCGMSFTPQEVPGQDQHRANERVCIRS